MTDKPNTINNRVEKRRRGPNKHPRKPNPTKKNGPTPRPVAVRLWEKVAKGTPEECWIWQGSFFAQGYGAFVLTSKKIRKAHRMAYELTYGPIPDGLIVRHTCDNPKCVNPFHLLIGTTQDNANDRVNRGRGCCGERSKKAKLKDDDVRAIIARFQGGESTASLAKTYGITRSQMTNICYGRAWRHLHG